MKKINLVEKWNKTGLLKGLEGDDAKTMAENLDSLTTDVLKCKSSNLEFEMSRQLGNVLFPIQRRLGSDKVSLRGKYVFVNEVKFMQIKDFVLEYEELKATDFGCPSWDVDVDFCKDMSKRMRNRIED